MRLSGFLATLCCFMACTACQFGEEQSKDPIPTERDLVIDVPGVQDDGREERVSKATQAAVIWLTQKQHESGYWAAGAEDYRTGVTGLVALALMASGRSSNSDELKKVRARAVDIAIKYLHEAQQQDGCIPDKNCAKYILSHAIATAALCEDYRLHPSGVRKQGAKRAVDYLLGAQNPGKGWRYSFKSAGNDTNVTFWAYLALRTAEEAGFEIPREAIAGVRWWMDYVYDEDKEYDWRGLVWYIHPGTGKAHVDPTPISLHQGTLAAMGSIAWTMLDRKKDVSQLRDYILTQPPQWNNESIFGYWFFGSLALGGYLRELPPKMKAWRDDAIKVFLKHQETSGEWILSETYGSYERDGGPAYATAMGVLTLNSAGFLPKVFATDSRK